MRLIPSIDLMGGRCVRLYQGDFTRKTEYGLHPAEILKRYEEAGADWVHLVDLDGARTGKPGNQSLIAKLARETSTNLQVGGGVRSVNMIEALLDAGVARAVIGSAAVKRPSDVCEWLRKFGVDRLCLAFDVRIGDRDQPRVYTQGWAQTESVSLWAALTAYGDLPQHVLCTDIGRDGTLSGPNIELYAQAVDRHPKITWQASGGIRDASDVKALAAVGVAAAVSGRALLEGMNLKEMQPFLPDASFPASTSATARS
jgi:phosphoribosylformimino-5-aminoimidazole carboxamide ribotide isomerase